MGDKTCPNLSWHIDTKIDPNAKHHIYIIGHNRTEFKKDGKIPEAVWHSYGDDVHRGVVADIPETRIFLRITESDIVRPRKGLGRIFSTC